jgi:hypothetical protein
MKIRMLGRLICGSPSSKCADRSRAAGAGEGKPDCGAGVVAATSQACQPHRVCVADRNTASRGIETWMRGRGRSGGRPSTKPSRPCALTPVSLRGRTPTPSISHGARYDSSTAWRNGAGEVRLSAHLCGEQPLEFDHLTASITRCSVWLSSQNVCTTARPDPRRAAFASERKRFDSSKQACCNSPIYLSR